MKMQIDMIDPEINYFVDRKCTSSWHLKRSIIDFHDITYVYEGCSTYFINDVPYEVSEGNIIYIPRGSFRHAFTNEYRPMQCYAVNFNNKLPGEEDKVLPLPVIIKVGDSSQLIRLYKDMNTRWLERKPGYSLITRSIFMSILYEIIYGILSEFPYCKKDRRVEKVKQYIINNCSNNDFTIKQISKMVNLNANYFGALFKKYTSYNLKEYIRHIRIRKAEDLLYTGEYTVSEVADLCGFENVYYFSKVFKEEKGISPSILINKQGDRYLV